MAMSQDDCPKCGSGLRPRDETTRSCVACGGIWITKATYADALADAGGTVALLDELDRVCTPTTYACPTCKVTTLEASHAKGVELDWCRTCGGIYFDLGELETVKGGSRRKESAQPAVARTKSRSVGVMFVDWMVTDLIASAASAVVDVVLD